MKKTVALIMAGGIGKRLWPESRLSHPKQLLQIAEEESLLQATYRRASHLFGQENTYLAIREEMKKEVISQLPQLSRKNLILEPKGRDTAPCIGFFAVWLRHRWGDIPMVVLPSDHLIRQEESFFKAIKVAGKQAEKNFLVTIGIKPTRVETGYGYLQMGEKIGELNGISLYKLKRFTEKPSHKKAKEFVEQGKFLWNAGIFVWKPSVILKEMEKFVPELFQGLSEIDKFLGTSKEEEKIRKIYPTLPKISIDYAVMEKTTLAVAIPGEFDWDDLGNWKALERIFPKDKKGNILRGLIVQKKCNNCIFLNREDKTLMAAIGVSNLILINSPWGILIVNSEMAQEVKDLVNGLISNEELKKYVE
jgi:mannose-1-phosphate guanylyltransferase